MNTKRILGALLAVIGIGGIIYTAILFIKSTSAASDIKALLIFGITGLIFFMVGMNLLRSKNDASIKKQ